MISKPKKVTVRKKLIACLTISLICLSAYMIGLYNSNPTIYAPPTPKQEEISKDELEYKKEIERLRRDVESIKTSRGESRTTPQPTPITQEEFNKDKVINAISNNLKGVFRGKAPFIYLKSKEFNLNPMLVTAIAYHETGNGTSSAVRNLNNPGGLMGNRGLMRFNSLEYGIEAMIKNLKKLYIDMGLTDIRSIGNKYCPILASNDPTGLNKYWIPAVTEKYIKILEESK